MEKVNNGLETIAFGGNTFPEDYGVKMDFTLPGGFLFGVSYSADQTEGGDVDSSWNDWYRKGKIKDGSDPAKCVDHWKRWKEDADLMKELGVKVCRMGLQWARIEPKEGEFDEKVIDRYREEIQYIKSLGIKPLVTIHHFGNPMWFEEKGGFLKDENLDLFLDYGKYMAERLGDIVSEWLTINEPSVYAFRGYLGYDCPPGHDSRDEYYTVLSNLCYCHVVLSQAIHIQREEMGYTDTMVSVPNHLRVFEPKNPSSLYHRFCTNSVKKAFQTAAQKALLTGEYTWPLKNRHKVQRGEFADFLAVNYYSRSTVSSMADGTREDCYRNDLGWEIYPEGITEVCKEAYEILPRPIWITENGTCDNAGVFRNRFIAEHLEQIAKSGLPVERYYHWCFTDNFEWLEGMSAKFGLVKVDPKTHERTPKAAFDFYKALIEKNGVDKEVYDMYIKNQHYLKKKIEF